MTERPDRTLLVGSSGGILSAVASQLAASGHQLYLVDADDDALTRQRKTLGPSVHGSAVVDVTATSAATTAFSRIAEEFEPTVLINGVGGDTRVIRYDDLDESHFQQAYTENVLGTFSAIATVVPGMETRGYGRIVNFASAGGRTYSHFNNAAYVAAKAAVIGMTKQMAYELAGSGVVVNVVAHGPIATDRVATAWENRPGEQKREVLSRLPMGRMGTLEEAVGSVLYLASASAGYSTGAVIDVNGGLWMG